ncbi:protein-S-isoprenylcysteine O-methyltransferase Ste14 [Sphingomonas naasensis]|uniref:Isoprenylcysteine carboxylmethyltransferase family protein n=1 Tax=Sphingomonas naasensis TaxID=1344951 RepID=A0A4S1WRT2_9SPHN|nr:isoprenylcysteine carboxylmethyltransferase family protein [Sphingomonas naasensis]NIJ18880.1 protein-S-isoprenylcysteine O-methyltransferase Ste14 [Sphingomonas naasensis]TGX46101.1 isoprenylcysteine carboxylmethyltransferase family protein [Sphingomonas naasensis]
MSLVAPQPTSALALGAMAAGFAIFLLSLLLTGSRGRKADPVAERRSPRSMLGVLVQMVGFLCVGFGPILPVLAPRSTPAVVEAMLVLVLMGVTIALFVSAARAMGRNWSIVARIREDHALITAGPFALIRHPIYTALFAFMLAMALAFGHWRGLIAGVPLYWLGTWLRVAEEEKLLRAQFGPVYEAYAARVARFVPGLF